MPDARIWAFVRRGREMVAWLEAHSAVRMRAHPYADYHPEMPGGKSGWRSLEALPLHASELGADFATLRAPSPAVQFMGRVSWTLEETGILLFRLPGWGLTALTIFGNYFLDLPHRLHSARDRRMTLGNALLGRLKLSLNRAGGQLWLRAPLTELIRTDSRRSGARIEHEGRPLRVAARRAVVLATGGLRAQCGAARAVPAAVPRAALERLAEQQHRRRAPRRHAHRGRDAQHGLRLVGHLDEPAGRGARAPHGVRARAAGRDHRQPERRALHERGGLLPRRRTRDAAPRCPALAHHPLVHAVRCHLAPQLPAGSSDPGPAGLAAAEEPDGGAGARRLLGGARREDAAAARSVCEATITRFNEHARRGTDPDFRRGESAYDRYYGDPKVTPNPTLRALERPPFYALPVYPGDIGTNGGLATNEHAQVLDAAGAPITRLYACGNLAASVMGHSYPAAGATLGPGMTFGYIAVRHALGIDTP